VEQLFRLIRMPLLPVPLLLWTLAWPLKAAATIAVAIPFRLMATTLLRAIGFPFVFLNAAFANEPEAVRAYHRNWQQSYTKTMSLMESIQIGRGYDRIVAWGHDPKSVPGTEWIVVANVIAVVLFACALSQAIRTVVGVLAVILVLLALWGDS